MRRVLHHEAASPHPSRLESTVLAVRCCRLGSSLSGRTVYRGELLPASAHLVSNFRDLVPPSPRGVLANATPRFSLAAHNQELVLGHVTFVLQQPFQIC